MATEETFTCSGCNKKLPRREFQEFLRENVSRPVTSKCKKCRKETRMAKLWPKTVCACCCKHRKLNTNGICDKCNADQGLRECHYCHKVLPLYLSFVQRGRMCKECLKDRPCEH